MWACDRGQVFYLSLGYLCRRRPYSTAALSGTVDHFWDKVPGVSKKISSRPFMNQINGSKAICTGAAAHAYLPQICPRYPRNPSSASVLTKKRKSTRKSTTFDTRSKKEDWMNKSWNWRLGALRRPPYPKLAPPTAACPQSEENKAFGEGPRRPGRDHLSV